MGNWLKKEFLLGIGIGCIISAFLVSVFGVGTISDEEVVARAARLGMVKQSMPWNGSGQETPKESKAEEPVAETDRSPGQTQNDDQSQTDQSQTDQSQTDQSQTESRPEGQSQIAKQAQPETSPTASITITDGMGSEAVARVLEQRGVIKDQYEFLKVVNSHKAQRRLQTGTFNVPIGGGLEEILDILLGRKR